MPALRTGIDLVEVTRFERINPRIRARFFQRVFTARERAEAGLATDEEPDPTALISLAGRFAGKEAVSKALGCGIGPVRWQEIEICRGPAGEPCLALHGAAQRQAETLGLDTWSLSISHTQTQAIAMAVALGGISQP